MQKVLTILRTQRRRLVLFSVGFTLVLLGVLLDQVFVDWLARPIESGQTKAAIRAMRCWGEGATIVVLSIAIVWVQPSLSPKMGAVLLLTLICAGVVDVIKPMFGRLRPSEVAVESNNAWVGGSSWNSSFPSGHTATAFAYARGLSQLFPTLKPVVLIAASGTALSRMYDQRHFFSDCVAGALLGWFLCGWGWRLLARLKARVASFVAPPVPQPSVAVS